MFGNKLLIAAIIALGLVTAAALLNQTEPASGDYSQGSGKYRVTATDKAFILYDVEDSRNSWILLPQPKQKRHAWFPVKRLDSESQLQTWTLTNRARQ